MKALTMLLLLLFAAACDHSHPQHMQPVQPNDTRGHEVYCTGCGSTFLQYGDTYSPTVDNCPSCELDMCEKGAWLAVAAAITGNEADMRPNDHVAASKYMKALQEITDHCEECERCRKYLGGPE